MLGLTQGWIGFEEFVLSLTCFLCAVAIDDFLDFCIRMFDWCVMGSHTSSVMSRGHERLAILPYHLLFVLCHEW